MSVVHLDVPALPARAWRRTVVRAAAALAALLAIIAMFATQDYFARHWGGGPLGFRSILLSHTISWFFWAVLAVIAIGPLARRYPVRGRVRIRNLGLHALLAPATAALHTAAVAACFAFYYYRFSTLAMYDMFRDRLHTSFAPDVLVYITIALAVHAVSAARESQQAALSAARLESRVARAEMSALQGQLRPHFLFNAFNSITALIETEPVTASRAVRTLSDLLRRSLRSPEPCVTLGEELTFVERYVELQRLRFPALTCAVHVSAEDLAALVPSFAVHTLVENAIQHTVGHCQAPDVQVTATRTNGRLSLAVSDNGVGLHAGPPRRTGTGLTNLRARLDQLYGAEWSLELANRTNGGAVVTVDFPA